MEKTYVTGEGLKKLRSDPEYHTTTRRREIAKQLDLVRSFGDLRENSEYEAAKHALSLNEIRIRKLEQKVAYAQIIDHDARQKGRISIGTLVTLRDLEDEEDIVYQLTGSEETDPAEGKISVNSPVAKAPLGHSIGDSVEIEVPGGTLKYKVVAIDR